ncbi:MAG: protein translocase SEC61 complex subunit gamma [Sulfolobales archaeon]|nr:protein translocase SEC61 complex subunit gamma [Sulfolobales archaeon]MCX8208254.1 protein translocase SEC61 complex subunit gamma [Sulfolobales archaeon]MDW8010857.1 protein translocase SEC61 complex subunit gamma [Sulfolobales archaeon]
MIELSRMVEMWQRILALSDRPEPEEFKMLIKVTLAGLLLIGGIGMVLHILLALLQGVGVGW